jgi:putative sigma-54 modulation protein
MSNPGQKAWWRVALDIKIVKNKSLQVSDEIQEYAEAKVNKLIRYGGRLQSAVITFTERASKNRAKAFKVEVVLHAPGQVLRNVEESQSFQAALDNVVDELKEQLKKLKAKRIDKTREPSEPEKASKKSAAKEAAVKRPRVTVKKFTLKPMGLDEAILQLNASGHGFFMFINEQKLMNCVYKRTEGGYGLLVPESEVQ